MPEVRELEQSPRMRNPARMLESMIKLMLCAAFAVMLLPSRTAQADDGIKVVIEGREVRFDSPPVVDQGNTLVPFRVLFEKLGLSVEWIQATKTVVGKGGGVAIELQLDRKTALINGAAVELSAAPRAIGGSVYVPLRFVGEATGRAVKWDGAARTIRIGPAPSGEPTDYDFEPFYRRFLAAGNAEDIGAIRALLHPDSPILGADWDSMAERFRIYDIRVELEQFEVLKASKSSAMLRTVETNVNANSLFHPDSRVTQLVHVLPDENGDWKIYDIERLETEYLVPDARLTADADIDKELEQALLAVVEAHIGALEAEDRDGVIGVFDPSAPELDLTRLALRAMFFYYDRDYELEYGNVLQAAGGEAFVYAVYTVRTIKGPEDEAFADGRFGVVYHLKRQADGGWKIYEITPILSEPPE
jgi:ketosteroid isomerase-like protein